MNLIVKTFLALTMIGLVMFIAIWLVVPFIPIFLGDEWTQISEVIIPLFPISFSRFAIAPLAKTFSALERQKEALLWQFFLFTSSTCVLFVCSYLTDFVFTIWAYSLTVTLGYFIMLYLVTSLRKNNEFSKRIK